MSYGYLRGNPHMWKGDGMGGGAPPFDYGFPSGGAAETDVIFQTIFTEGSGNLIEKVQTAALTVIGGGTLTYSYDTSDYSPLMAAGIYFATPGVTSGFGKAGADSNYDIGTSNFTIEVISKCTATRNGGTLLDTRDSAASPTKGIVLAYAANSAQLSLLMYGDGGGIASAAWNTPSPAYDTVGTWRKIRISCVRASNATLYIDGVDQGTKAITNVTGQALSCQNAFVGLRVSSVGQINTFVIKEIRVSKNATNNSGGPGGG